jgi:hypothetical protein
MDASTSSAVSALMGSVVEAGVSLTTTWIAQRYSTRQERVRERARQRERLYSKFISEAAHLQLDAFGHQLDSAKAVVRIAGLVNRVRLIGGPEVVAAAERCVNEIIESYLSPNLTLEELFERRPWRDRDPLRAFSEACRREIAGEV